MTMKPDSRTRAMRLPVVAAVLILAAGCSALGGKATPQPSFYALQYSAASAAVAAAPTAPTLIVNPPRAAAGFDSSRIIYVREAHKLEYFAHNEWVDSPARMLAPLMVTAIEHTGAFRAVVTTPSAATGEMRLDSEIVRLQQDFTSRPGSVRFTLRAHVVENESRRVLAWREFDVTVATPGEDPRGGVVAANEAVGLVLGQLAEFCAGALAGAGAPPGEAARRDEVSPLWR